VALQVEILAVHDRSDDAVAVVEDDINCAAAATAAVFEMLSWTVSN